MTRKPMMAGGVAIAIVVFTISFLVIAFPTSRPITIRHVKSVHSGDVTAATFEIRNHAAAPYIFYPFEVQVRNGTVWSKCLGFKVGKVHPLPTLDPMGLASYTVEVTNLPAGSVVRFKIRAQKILTGLNGLLRRFELNFGSTRSSISLNPFDKTSTVFEIPREVVSDEFVEPEQK